MKLSNPLEMNDWRISRFMLFSFFILALLWITFILNLSGFQIPLIQQLAGCICLLFIPGVAILRILRLHQLGSVEALLYAIGISISVVVFSGFALNEIAPVYGISDPLSALHLILFMSGIIIALCVASYWRDKDFASPTQLNKDILSPGGLSLLLLPFLAIFGAYLVNNYEINWLILLTLLYIGIVVLVICSRKNIDRSLYPLAIFVISLSLLLCNTLISQYLWGWDVFVEARVVDSVVSHAVWDPLYAILIDSTGAQIVARLNSVLSLSILGPSLSQIGNFDTTSLFKITYPAIFSLVPVALYQLYRKQTNDTIAFLASFFNVTIITFFLEMPSLARQEIGELFFVLVLLLIFNKTFRPSTRAFLLILFSGTMIVSYYGITWLLMLQLFAVLVLLFLVDNTFLRDLKQRLFPSVQASQAVPRAQSLTSSTRKDSAITVTFFLLFTIMAFAWYAYTANSLLLIDLLQRSLQITSSDFAPGFQQTAQQLQGPTALILVVAARLNTVASLLIFLGVVAAFIQRKKMKFNKAYLGFAVTSCVLAILVFSLPTLFVLWNSSRLQHIYIMILAPFLIIGVMTLFRVLRYATKTFGRYRDIESKAYPTAAVFLVILLLFNTGFVLAVAHEPVLLSPSLFHEDLLMFVHPQDIAGAKWLGSATGQHPVYTDSLSRDILLAYSNFPIERLYSFSYWTNGGSATVFVCTSEASIDLYAKNAALYGRPFPQSPEFTGELNKIYDSGAVIYST